MSSTGTRAKIALVGCCIFTTKSWALRPSQYGPGPGQNPMQPPTSNANNPTAYDDYEYNPPTQQGIDLLNEHESVEERLQRWRQEQQYKYEHQSPIDAANPRQEDGKMKLLASVSKGSIAMFFFILMWRAVHHYEMADLAFTGTTRLFMVIPPVVLFLGNMAGCVGSLTSNGALGKKRMKGILNLNKLVEVSLLAYNVSRLIIVPSKLIPREVFVGRTLSNFLFLVQCQLFTKVTWAPSLLQTSPDLKDTAERVYGNVGTSSVPYRAEDYGDRNADASFDPGYQQGYAQDSEWR